MKRNGYFTFQMIIDITGACGIISFGMRGLQRCFSNSSGFKMLCRGLNIHSLKQILHFSIIGIAGACGTISDAVCVSSTVIIIFTKNEKKLTNKCTQKIWNFQLD